jgi:hypothetical protein
VLHSRISPDAKEEKKAKSPWHKYEQIDESDKFRLQASTNGIAFRIGFPSPQRPQGPTLTHAAYASFRRRRRLHAC